jgi:hypothetical protein
MKDTIAAMPSITKVFSPDFNGDIYYFTIDHIYCKKRKASKN